MRNAKNTPRAFQSAMVLLLGIGVLLPSCSKDESEPAIPTAPTGGTQNQFYLVTDQTPEDSLVAAFHWAEKSLTFNYYGLKDPGGTVASIYSASLRKDGSDTTHIFMLNDDGNVSSYFSEVGGLRDSTVLKVSYQDTLVIVSAYHMDWVTNIITLREQVVQRIEDGVVISVVRGGDDMAAAQSHTLSASNGLLTFIGFLLIYSNPGVTIATGVGASLAALGIIDMTGFSISSMNDLIDQLNNFLFPNAEASEVDNIPGIYFNDAVNPQVSIDFINSNPSNEHWAWCACAAYFLTPHTGWMDWQVELSAESDLLQGNTIPGTFLMCDTGAVNDGGIGFMFSVRPGGWATFHQGEAGGCPSVPVGTWRTIGTFSCPN